MTGLATTIRGLAVVAVVTLLAVPGSLAQSGLVVSRNSDFSTNDLRFEPGETVYVLVKAPDIDATDLDQNEVRFRQDGRADGFRGALTNHFDGSYTAEFVLPATDEAVGHWILEVRLRDDVGHEFESRLVLSVGVAANFHEFEVRGLVTDIGDQFIAVMHRKILVNSETEIHDEAGQQIRLSEIQVGDQVHVRGVIRADGTPVATRIELKNKFDHEIEFVGVIQEVLDRAVVMFGRTIHVVERTEILNQNGEPIPFSELEAGMMAKVRVRIEMDRIIALRIQIRARDNFEFEVKGVITAIRDRGFDLENHFIAVNEETEYFGPDGQPIEFADLRVGHFVQVHGVISNSGTPLARRVKVEDRIGPREFEVEGFIREKGDRSILVSGHLIFVTDDTKIVGEDGLPIEFADLQVGHYVDAQGFVSADGKLIARLIEVEDPARHEITVSGRIQKIGDRMFVVREIPFLVTNETRIFDETGEPFPFSELQVGMFVRVHGLVFRDRDHALALKVEVRTRRFVHLTGTIQEIGTEGLLVSGIRVLVGDHTVILNIDNEPIELADLQVGQIVKVFGWKTDSGVMAKLIKVALRVEDEVLVSGVLEAVEDSSIVLLGVDFRVLSTTVIKDESGNDIGLDALEVGRPIQVRGDLMADGMLVAFRIKKLDHDVRGIRVVGPVETVGAGTIEVIGIHFFVDGRTEIVGANGQRIDLMDIEVGQTVALHAIGQPDGTRLALRIRVLDVLVAMGDVDLWATDHVRMFGVDFRMQSDLMVMLDGGRSGSLDATSTDMLVEIRAATDDSGQMSVTKVTLHQDSGSTVLTAGDPGSDLPGSFVLKQNYPNPFNPSTTIELELFEAGPVTLKVYNVLGQEVKTVSEGILSPGTYTFVWDGTDGSGVPVASGIYLYRVRSGSTAQARTMTLIK